MTRLELTISPDYVSKWGVWEAVREILQNTIDNKEKEQIFSYNASKQILTIGNKDTVLEKQTLLLGNSTKRNDSNTIGQYGEGYKLALLILTRLGKRIEIKNGKEIWFPKIIKSRKYDSELLVMDIEKTKENKDLEFVIYGITKSEFEKVMDRTLIYADAIEKIETPYGNILLDEKYRRKVFVEGLYVKKMIDCENMRYGYDIKANHIELDRDRMSVSEFNLFWETSRMFAYLIRENQLEYGDMIYGMVSKEMADVSYLKNMMDNSVRTEMFEDLCEMCAKDFLETYGTNAIIAHNNSEAKIIKEKYNNIVPVVMPETKTVYIEYSGTYQSNKSKLFQGKEVSTPYEIVNEFLIKNRDKMSDDLLTEFSKLLKESRNWTIRAIEKQKDVE